MLLYIVVDILNLEFVDWYMFTEDVWEEFYVSIPIYPLFYVR